jgi:hypothetical protein
MPAAGPAAVGESTLFSPTVFRVSTIVDAAQAE